MKSFSLAQHANLKQHQIPQQTPVGPSFPTEFKAGKLRCILMLYFCYKYLSCPWEEDSLVSIWYCPKLLSTSKLKAQPKVMADAQLGSQSPQPMKLAAGAYLRFCTIQYREFSGVQSLQLSERVLIEAHTSNK